MLYPESQTASENSLQDKEKITMRLQFMWDIKKWAREPVFQLLLYPLSKFSFPIEKNKKQKEKNNLSNVIFSFSQEQIDALAVFLIQKYLWK